jgi:hypothetical protein
MTDSQAGKEDFNSGRSPHALIVTVAKVKGFSEWVVEGVAEHHAAGLALARAREALLWVIAGAAGKAACSPFIILTPPRNSLLIA